jgi:hypothetical protein
MLGKIATAALLAASLICVALPAAASDKSDVEAAIRKTLHFANTGNDAAFAAMIAPGGIVIDEFAPFRWDGLGAWAAAYGAYNRQNAVTVPRTKILRFKHINVGGGRAYAVLDVVYSYKAGAVARSEKGTDVFVLAKTSEGWRFLGFAWASAAGVDAGVHAAAVTAAVRDLFDGFNSGKIDFAKLGWNGVIDEFPAYAFLGATTVADWGAGFQASGQKDLVVTLAAPTHLSVNGDDAYTVVPATIAGTMHGKPLKEHGAFALALSKVDGTWQVRSWAWVLG